MFSYALSAYVKAHLLVQFCAWYFSGVLSFSQFSIHFCAHSTALRQLASRRQPTDCFTQCSSTHPKLIEDPTETDVNKVLISFSIIASDCVSACGTAGDACIYTDIYSNTSTHQLSIYTDLLSIDLKSTTVTSAHLSAYY